MNQPQTTALNAYFVRFRDNAVGLSATVSGFGAVVIPKLATWMLEWYTPEGVMMVLAALVLHSLVASVLLQPVKWHMKPAKPQVT